MHGILENKVWFGFLALWHDVVDTNSTIYVMAEIAHGPF